MKAYEFSCQKSYYYKNFNFPKIDIQIQLNPNENFSNFLCVNQVVLNFLWKWNGPNIINTIMNNKNNNKIKDLIIPKIKTC